MLSAKANVSASKDVMFPEDSSTSAEGMVTIPATVLMDRQATGQFKTMSGTSIL